MTVRTHYDNLKVSRTASSDEIKDAYRRLTQKHHPDKHGGSAEKARVMLIINDAYDTLIDPDRRRAHDAWISQQERVEAPTGRFRATVGDVRPPPVVEDEDVDPEHINTQSRSPGNSILRSSQHRDTRIAFGISLVIFIAFGIWINSLVPSSGTTGPGKASVSEPKAVTPPQRTTTTGPLGQKLVSTIEDQVLPASQRLAPLDSGAPIRGYLEKGYLNSKPVIIGHSDYWVFQKEAKLFDMPLFALAEEYEHPGTGCCADRRIEVLFVGETSSDGLTNFGVLNHCELTKVDPIAEKYRGLPFAAGTRYVSLNCREKRNL